MFYLNLNNYDMFLFNGDLSMEKERKREKKSTE